MKLFRWLRNKALPTVVGSDSFQTILASHGVPPVLLDKLEGVVERRAAQRIADDVAAKPVMTPKPKRNLMSGEEEQIMARKPQPDAAFYGLEEAFIYPYYQTREDYEKATGKPCPPYLDNGRPKYWEGTVEADADPDLSIRFSVPYTSRGGVSRSVDGTPRVSFLDLKPEEITRVNIPPKQVGSFPGSTSAVEIQPPMELLPNERLEFQAGIAAAQLRIRRIDKIPTTATMSERQLLEAIAKKVGAI
jgi:hypothetical protein